MNNNFNTKSISILFGKLAILCIVFGFYFTFLIEGFTGITSTRNIFLFLGVVFFLGKLIFNRKIIIQRDYFIYALLSIPIACISIFFWYSLNEINVYISLITSIIVIASDFNYFKKLVKNLSYLLLLLVIYEFLTKTYIFVVQRDTEFGTIVLDPKLFGGYSGIFRGKGLFEGPLALAQYAIGLAFLFRQDIKVLLIACALAVFANGRLGMIICFAILGIYFMEKYGLFSFLRSKKGLKTLGIISISLLIIGIFFIDEIALERLRDVINIADTSNSARLFYWQEGVEIFFDYPFINKIVGNSGYYRHVVGNSAENGWLMLLLNNGIVGFLYYFTPLVVIAYMSIKLKTYHVMLIFLLFLCMMIQTFHLGALANLFYWLIIYSFFLELNRKTKHE